MSSQEPLWLGFGVPFIKQDSWECERALWLTCKEFCHFLNNVGSVLEFPQISSSQTCISVKPAVVRAARAGSGW